jgi:hypothetical protein|tara:strand:- start:782 stop:1024 length:243 start_codon:yes stop_codon:yes gene_type:complete
VLGVPVDNDGGEQVQPGHPEMLAFGCPVANFTLAANTQRILEGVMGFALVQADLGATRYDRCPKVFLSAIALAALVIYWL